MFPIHPKKFFQDRARSARAHLKKFYSSKTREKDRASPSTKIGFFQKIFWIFKKSEKIRKSRKGGQTDQESRFKIFSEFLKILFRGFFKIRIRAHQRSREFGTVTLPENSSKISDITKKLQTQNKEM